MNTQITNYWWSRFELFLVYLNSFNLALIQEPELVCLLFVVVWLLNHILSVPGILNYQIANSTIKLQNLTLIYFICLQAFTQVKQKLLIYMIHFFSSTFDQFWTLREIVERCHLIMRIITLNCLLVYGVTHLLLTLNKVSDIFDIEHVAIFIFLSKLPDLIHIE